MSVSFRFATTQRSFLATKPNKGWPAAASMPTSKDFLPILPSEERQDLGVVEVELRFVHLGYRPISIWFEAIVIGFRRVQALLCRGATFE